LKRGGYSPLAQGTVERELNQIRISLLGVLDGKPLSVQLIDPAKRAALSEAIDAVRAEPSIKHPERG
jgi:hypothetical protein